MSCLIRIAFFAIFCIFAFGARSLACPHFVEFFSDPVDVPDQQGEFIEVRLDDFLSDSLYILMDEKTSWSMKFPRGKRLVLVHDSLYCPNVAGIACGLMQKLSLPNSRSSIWKLQAGSCEDSIVVPTPKAGKALQRVRQTDRWEFVAPSKGLANPSFEDGVADCGIAPVLREQDPTGDSLWRYTLRLTGCDSAWLRLETISLKDGAVRRDSLMMGDRYTIQEAPGNFIIRGSIPNDESPSNDSLDTLMVDGKGFPMAISEIHHCPQEPEPEWVEVYNRSAVSLSLDKFRFCNRGGLWGVGKSSTDSQIEPYESVILTKDTLGLREYLGFRDVKLLQVALGYLNNTSGCLAICNGETVVDSACWDRHTVTCPAGFSPLTLRADNTPGYIHADEKTQKLSDVPFTYRLSSRIVRVGGNPLRALVEGNVQVRLKLLDSAGRDLWHCDIPPQSNAWWNVPLDSVGIGVAYISLSSGKYENVVGILVRP